MPPRHPLVNALKTHPRHEFPQRNFSAEDAATGVSRFWLTAFFVERPVLGAWCAPFADVLARRAGCAGPAGPDARWKGG